MSEQLIGRLLSGRASMPVEFIATAAPAILERVTEP